MKIPEGCRTEYSKMVDDITRGAKEDVLNEDLKRYKQCVIREESKS